MDSGFPQLSLNMHMLDIITVLIAALLPPVLPDLLIDCIIHRKFTFVNPFFNFFCKFPQ